MGFNSEFKGLISWSYLEKEYVLIVAVVRNVHMHCVRL
jgi:hypothetical protein